MTDATSPMGPITAVPRSTPRPPRIVWLGLAVVLAAAAVLSFDGLRGLGLTVGIPDRLAWLLPIAVDAGAAVSCATWLGGRTDRHAARYAGRMTWALLAVTVGGNAGHLGMHAHGITPPWWVAVLVGAIPPAVVGATVHLAVLLTRPPAIESAGAATEPAESAPAAVPLAYVDEAPLPLAEPEAPAGDARAAELIAEGAGRRRLSRELSITEYEARQLLATHTNGGAR